MHYITMRCFYNYNTRTPTCFDPFLYAILRKCTSIFVLNIDYKDIKQVKIV